MARTLRRRFTTVAATVLLTSTAVFGIAAWRRSEDTKWCRKAVAGGAVSDTARPPTPDLVRQEQSACAVQRRRQRAYFGTVWRSDGPAMAACGFEWSRLQILTVKDAAAATAILTPYGITDPDFDTSSGTSETRFIHACLASRHQ